jgi:hypothetical protein
LADQHANRRLDEPTTGTAAKSVRGILCRGPAAAANNEHLHGQHFPRVRNASKRTLHRGYSLPA